jgi:hypothetical protein
LVCGVIQPDLKKKKNNHSQVKNPGKFHGFWVCRFLLNLVHTIFSIMVLRIILDFFQFIATGVGKIKKAHENTYLL